MARSCLAVLALAATQTSAQGNLPCFTNFGNSSFNLAPFRSGTATGYVPIPYASHPPTLQPIFFNPPSYPTPLYCPRRYSVIDSLNNANSRNYTYYFDL
jgi:hypothetical protein